MVLIIKAMRFSQNSLMNCLSLTGDEINKSIFKADNGDHTRQIFDLEV